MKKKILDSLKNPDKILIEGFRTLSSLPALTGINFKFYSRLRSSSKGKSEIAFIGEKKLEEVKTQLYVYDAQSCEASHQVTTFKPYDQADDQKVYWLNFHGIHDVQLIQKLADVIQLDRLTVRQIVDTTQRPKVDDYDHYLFFSVKSILNMDNQKLNVEQLSFVMGNHFVISFQEEAGDHFDHLRAKLKEGLGLIRSKDCDYLLSQLLDAILDNYFETIDAINEGVAILAHETLNNPTQETLLLIEQAKKSAELIKKSLTPFKEALTNILKDRTRFLRKSNVKYFRDLKNSCSNAIEGIEATYKSLDSLTNIYFSSLSQKMNETMKVLTTVATIFIPLTFIAGIYGMNFENMPELHYRYGYYIIMGLMGIVLIVMLIYFKRKKWL